MQEQIDQLLDQLEKLNPQQKWGGLVAAVAVIIGLFFYFVAMDMNKQIDRKNAEFNRLNNERTEKESVVKNLPLYEAKFNELQGQLVRAQSLLPDSEEVPALLTNLSSLGESAGLTIERFQPKEEEAADFYAAIPFHMEVHGNYHDIAIYIDRIGRLDRIVNVSNIQMSNPKVLNKKIVVDSNFTITTYRFLKDGEAGNEG